MNRVRPVWVLAGDREGPETERGRRQRGAGDREGPETERGWRQSKKLIKY
jgi:hypothetical protein